MLLYLRDAHDVILVIIFLFEKKQTIIFLSIMRNRTKNDKPIFEFDIV